jgi:hypothetical protein
MLTPLTLLFFSYNTFVSSSFLPVEEAAIHAMAIKSKTEHASLLLSFSDITGHPCRQLVLCQNGNLMASSFKLHGHTLRRTYFRLSFPEDPEDSRHYRGPVVASPAHSDLFRLLSHYAEQLCDMCCSPAPLSMENLENNARTPNLVAHFSF